MRTIDVDALIEKCGDWYVEEGTESGFIGTLKNLLATMPTIQPEKAQLSKEDTTSDLISRTATIDAVNNAFDRETLLTMFVRSIAVRAIRDMPSIQPEPAIPLSWIEKHIEWNKSLDSEFANLAAAHISVMVKKWRDEQNE